MFSDLVGSTALSARMDPEDLRDVISAYQKCVAETVQSLRRLRGEVYGRWRAGVFRLSQAHEDDAERAVRAGLELIAAVGAQGTRFVTNAVGIATGLVVVGDLIGSGEAQERAIVGETPNLAARLARDRGTERSSLRRARGSFSAICSSCKTSGRKNSKVSQSGAGVDCAATIIG